MTAIMRQIDEMEQKEEAVKAGPCFTQLEARVGHGNEKVGEKRRSRDACDAGGEGPGQGLRGEGGGAGGEKLENKRKKEAKHTQGSFDGKGKEDAVEERKRPSSEEDNEAQEQQHEEGVGGSRASGEAAKAKRAKCPHNRQKKPMLAMRGFKHVRASPNLETVQAMQWTRHLRAQPHKKRMQAMQRLKHLRAQPSKKRVQAMRRVEHLRAQPRKKRLQAMRGVEHLGAQPSEK